MDLEIFAVGTVRETLLSQVHIFVVKYALSVGVVFTLYFLCGCSLCTKNGRLEFHLHRQIAVEIFSTCEFWLAEMISVRGCLGGTRSDVSELTKLSITPCHPGRHNSPNDVDNRTQTTPRHMCLPGFTYKKLNKD